MIRTVWEVYEKDTNRCLLFATKEQAENQNVLLEVDCIVQSDVDVTDNENTALDNGLFIFC